jgi:ribosome-binding factor A
MDVIGRTNFRDSVLASCSVTVTEVSLSPDLRHATAFVTPFGMDNPDGLVAALNRAAPYLRHQIASELRLRLLPDLRFSEDKAHAYASRIDELLRRPEVARDIAAPAESAKARPRRAPKTRSRES